MSEVHKLTNPVRVGDRPAGTEMFNTLCSQVVHRYQCTSSDFKTTCEKCVREIIARREKELEVLKLKLRPDDWKFKNLTT